MNAMGTITTLVTFEEFERLPDEPGKLELMNGELIRMPPAETRHVRIALRLYKHFWDAPWPGSRSRSGRSIYRGGLSHRVELVDP
jgi:Uma2 family endonuclease